MQQTCQLKSVYRGFHNSEMAQDTLVELVSEASEWCYRGEGAANIVLAYNGSNPSYLGKVLRLQKILFGSKHSSHKKVSTTIEPGIPVLSKEEQVLWGDWPLLAAATSVEGLMQTFAKQVMSPLLGYQYVDPGLLVLVSSQFLKSVRDNIYNARPYWRAEVSQVNIWSSTGLLMSDHSVLQPVQGFLDKTLSSFAVEIKPKCGFLPNSRFISAENSVKKKISRFAMHQVLKFSQRQVKSVSCYSPLDLFSGSVEGITKAIHDLFSNPQNNLRAFVDGKVIEATMVSTDVATPDWRPLEEALKNCISTDDNQRVEILKGLVSKILVETVLLNSLLAAQELDTYDIEGAILVYQKMYGNCSDTLSPSSSGSRPSNMDKKWKLSTPTFENKIELDFKCLDKHTLTESRKIVRDYLIAATAKDCSLMLAFEEMPENAIVDADTESLRLIHCPETGKCFRSKINFLDLDLKRLHKMVHYYELDQDIVKAYTSSRCQN